MNKHLQINAFNVVFLQGNNMSMKCKIFLTTILLFFQILLTQAQDEILLKEKPGTFKITHGTLNGQGPDQYMKSCSYTNAEAWAAKKNMIGLVDVFRLNPVLKEIRGFDGEADFIAGRCNTKFGYGLPLRVWFYFKSWSLRKGREVQWTSEPPQWIFEVNMTEKFCSEGFNVMNYNNEGSPTNPAYKEESMDKAAFSLRELFYLPGIKEVVGPGIDRYGDNLIIFNPDRPEYWKQITIREVFRLLIDYWKLMPDKIQVETILPMLEKEFSGFSETEKDGFAYFGRPETIYRIGSERNHTPVMRPNPEYWNKKLPRSAIQFIWLEIPVKEEVKRLLDANLQEESGYYYVYRLLDELDVNTLIPAIEK
jgi:hypothetical protein